MSLDTMSLIDMAITGTELEHGRRPARISVPVSSLAGVRPAGRKAKALKWSIEQDDFLRRNLGWMDEETIAEVLGRTKIAVHLHWKRDLHLTAPSKAPDVITATRAAEMLGIDAHKIAHWVDIGLIPNGRLMAGHRKIRLIPRLSFMVWACAPKHWVYFDPNKVIDPHLQRLIRLEQKRWGDEWWSTRRVADYHGVDAKVIQHQIKSGRLSGFHLQVSLGGRHPKLRYWSNWFVLKSEVIKLKIPHRGDGRSKLTPAGKAWIGRALQMGWNAADITRSMKASDDGVVLFWIHRYFPGVKLVKGGRGGMASKRHIHRKSCEGKRAFKTQEEAVREAGKASRFYSNYLTAYHCKFGNHFHIGHPPKEVRRALRAKRILA